MYESICERHTNHACSYGLCNIVYPPETHLKSQSREISFVHNLWLSCPDVLDFCIEHGSDICLALCKISKWCDEWKIILWTNKILRDLSLRCVSGRYTILQQPLDLYMVSLSLLCCVQHCYKNHVMIIQDWQIMMTSPNGQIFCVTGPFCGKFADHRWISLTKASDAALWCFLWSASEQTV